MSIAVARSQGQITFNFVPKIGEKTEARIFVRSEFDKILDGFNGIGRGPERYTAFLKGSVVVYSLAEMFARRVAGKHNKNVIFILFGDLGGGKSMALVKLAISCAQWLTALRGGKPSKYFSFNNIAVIDPEMLQEKLANLEQYGIYILDDAGPGYDARTFMSKSNRDLNYILQTCRTSNNIILVSAPHGAMLDVTIHRVAQYYGEISEIHHDEGITFLKVFRLVRIFREGKIFYVYMTKNGVSIRRFYSSLPIPAIKKKYDLVRDAQAKVIQRRRAEREEKEKNERERKPRDFGNIRFKRETLEKIRSICTENPHVTAKEICAHAGVSYQLMDRLVIEAGIQNINVGEGKKKKVWKVDTNWR